MDKTLFILLIGIGSVLRGQAAPGNNRLQSYQAIPQRNAFHLKPIPPPSANTAPLTPPPKVTFTGITVSRGHKTAYFALHDPKKLMDPTAILYPALREGEREGPLQVVRINDKAGAVTILNEGVEMTLTFDKNGNQPSAPAATVASKYGIPVLPGTGYRGVTPKPVYQGYLRSYQSAQHK